jgi:hypothetical protein
MYLTHDHKNKIMIRRTNLMDYEELLKKKI